MQQREEKVLSIRSMIQRFRETKPTSRQEREQVRKHRKMNEQLWRARDDGPAEKDDDIQRNSRESDRPLLPDSHHKTMRWAGAEVRSAAKHNSAYLDADNFDLAVDKLMSEDIQRFMATGADRSDRAAKPPRVFSSPSLAPTSHKHSHALMESYPRKSLVFPSGRETQALGGFKTARDEENQIKPYLRDLALGPLTYTGSAELRGGTPPISSQPDDLGRWGEQLNLVPNEDATRATVSSAADVTSDLDGVLKQLRSGMIHEVLIESPGQLTPRVNLPVNLAQIAHDLDAKLLEFTLMAKAREQIADEAHTAEEVEKDAWRQGETKRVEEMVRQEYATLQHTTNGRQSLSPTSEEGSVQIGHMLPRFPGQWKSRGYDSQRELKALRKFSTEHPALPPSALGGPTLHTLEHAGAPAEAVAHQMADILRDVEAKVQRIEALEIDGSRVEEEREAQPPNDVPITATKSPPGTIAPSHIVGDKHHTANDVDASCTKDAGVYESDKLLTPALDQSKSAAELDDTLTTGGVMDMGALPLYTPNISCGEFSERLLVPSEAQTFPDMVQQSWLNGQATLQEAGRCIGAELEVTMLCMQKRLGKQPIEQGVGSEGGKEESSADDALRKYTEEPHEKVADTMDVGGPLEASLQESLMVLADDMATCRERETHEEVDRELGLSFKDVPDRWCDRDCANNRLHFGGQMQRDVVKPISEIGEGMAGYDPPSTLYQYSSNDDVWAISVDGSLRPNTGLRSGKDMAGASPLNKSPALAPSGGTTFQPAPPAPLPYPILQSKANQSRLPTGSSMFLEKNAPIRDLGESGGKMKHLSMKGHLQRNDVDGGGFAVARARQRLHSFRTARKGTSTDINVIRRPENVVPRQLPVDQRMVPPSRDDSKLVLGRLREMRHSLHAT